MKRNLRNKSKKYIKKSTLGIILILSLGISIILVTSAFFIINNGKEEENIEEIAENSSNMAKKGNNVIEAILTPKKEIEDWRLILVNKENPLPEDYKVELENVEGNKQVDKRIVEELKEMMQAMKNSNIDNIWIQSSYRTIEYQETLYNNKINEYLSNGATQEQAEKLTLEYINRPGESEHNLGLAVDFNNVDNDFKNTEAYSWLKENAKDYGFVMRYPEEKAGITGVAYEPWHWRYVGKENAYKMEELNMCLEEYRKYLETN